MQRGPARYRSKEIHYLTLGPLPSSDSTNDDADRAMHSKTELRGSQSCGEIVGEKDPFRKLVHDPQRFNLAGIELQRPYEKRKLLPCFRDQVDSVEADRAPAKGRWSMALDLLPYRIRHTHLGKVCQQIHTTELV